MKQKKNPIVVPEGLTGVLLHACCAPCSSAIVEWMIANGIRPVIFYYNPNIYPREEYEIRKNESKRHAESLGLTWIDGDYDHDGWRCHVQGLEHEPERGSRCLQCFRLRLLATARKAAELGLSHFTTTLASSRWKSIEQINAAGFAAEEAVSFHNFTNSPFRDLTTSQSPLRSEGVGEVPRFWAQNWRKGGLSDRRNQLLKEFAFYNQQYCGCEYSMRG